MTVILLQEESLPKQGAASEVVVRERFCSVFLGIRVVCADTKG